MNKLRGNFHSDSIVDWKGLSERMIDRIHSYSRKILAKNTNEDRKSRDISSRDFHQDKSSSWLRNEE